MNAASSPVIVFPRRLASVRTWDEIAAEPVTPPAVDVAAISAPPSPPQTPEPTAELLQQIDASLKALRLYEQQQQAMMRQTIVELAVVAAETVLGHAVTHGHYDIAARVEQAIRTFGAGGALRIGLNPDDIEAADRALQSSPHASGVQLEANASVPRGECHVSSPQETFCTNLTTQLETIRRAWLESIHDTAA